MKLETIAALCTLVAAANAHAAAKPDTGIFGRHAQLAQKRQETAVAGAAAAASSASSARPCSHCEAFWWTQWSSSSG